VNNHANLRKDCTVDSYRELKRLVDTFEKVSTDKGIPTCITIVDMHGHPVLLHRMPGSPVLALEMSERKAYTSMVMRCETSALPSQILPGQPLYSLTSSSTRLIAFGGGSYVQFETEIFGVGVSGGTTDQDIEILNIARVVFGAGDWAVSD
jgi:uncharacterized protein GlcG (DUF336 family)